MRTNPSVLLLAAVVVLVNSNPHQKYCPPEAAIQPCKCEIKWDYKSSLLCGSTLKNVSQLRQIIQKSSSGAYDELELNSLSIDYIPVDILERKQLQTLRVNGSSLIQLFDRSPRNQQHRLEELILRSVNLKWGMNFDLLAQMKKLNMLSLENVSVPIVGEDFEDSVTSEMIFLYFIRTSTHKIIPNAFSRLSKLSVLMIIDNKITSLQRDMLPLPSNLEILLLNKNLLTSLPTDMFFGMPKLRTVSVRDNRLTTLDEMTFMPVSYHVRHLDVYENRLFCDCKLKWIIAKENEIKSFGSCSSPKSLEGKPIKELISEDFKNCD